MGRRQGKKGNQQKGPAGEEQSAPAQPEYVQPADPPRAVLAVHPAGAAIAVAVGPELRVYDARTGQHKALVGKPEQPAPAAQQPTPPAHGAAPFVRGVAFDAAGRYLLAGGEDKAQGIRLWDASSWELLQCIKVPKKVTNVAFTADGRNLLAADKFGDVLVAAAERPAGLKEGQQQEPEILLGHFCAILTSLSLSANGRLLATTDRDNRVRVSIVPSDPLAGAHEIQSLCFGHAAFVTCSAFVQHADQELLVSGGGDGTLRLWDPLVGRLLDTFKLPQVQQAAEAAGGRGNGAQAPAAEQQQQQQQQGEQQAAAADAGAQQQQEQLQQLQQQQEEQQMEADAEGGSSGDEQGEEEGGAAAGGEGGGEQEAGCSRDGGAPPTGEAVPLALAASPDGRWVVAAVDGRDALCLLRVDWSARRLQEVGWFALPGLHLPACLSFDASGRLWAAGGPVTDDSSAAFLACISVEDAAEGGQPALVAGALPDWLPQDAVAGLEAKVGNEAELLAAAAERRRLASQVLQKRKFSLQQLEHRKRLRRDKVAAAAAAAKAQAQAGSGKVQAKGGGQ